MFAISNRKDQIAIDDKQLAVNQVLESQQVKLNETISQLKEKAKEEKDSAIKREVKKALEEAAKQQAEKSDQPEPTGAKTETIETPQPGKQETE